MAAIPTMLPDDPDACAKAVDFIEKVLQTSGALSGAGKTESGQGARVCSEREPTLRRRTSRGPAGFVSTSPLSELTR